jgi:hypothetical protein
MDAMKLNCKQGDLAVIVRSFAGNEGKIVTCIRLATMAERAYARFDNALLPGEAWVIDRVVLSANGMRVPLAYDAQLRPLRDSEGEDEVLRLVGLPNVDAPRAA